MFLRATIRWKDGKQHRYWSVVESRRVAGKRVVQRPLLYLGEINDNQRAAWRKSIAVLEDGKTEPRTLSLFPDDRVEGLLRMTRSSVCGCPNSACAGLDNGAPAGWPCIYGKNCTSTGSGCRVCRPAVKARAGITCCSYWPPTG